jgi:hypothetical protein
MIPSMLQHPRAFLGVVALNGLVFALGGQDDSGALLKSVEVYGTAQQLAEASIPVSSASPRGKGSRAAGGDARDHEAPLWAMFDAMALPTPMCNFAACVI